MKKFIQDYQNYWTALDFSGLILLGPLISFISKLLLHEKLEPK